MTNIRKHILLKGAHDFFPVGQSPPVSLVRVPLAANGFKRVLDRKLLSKLLRLFLGYWVNAIRNLLASLTALFSRLSQRYQWVGTKGHQLGFSGIAIAKTPTFTSISIDKKRQALAVVEGVGFFLRFGASNLYVS
ncbi:hypothetical protein D3C80_1458690 [compost metagenome]